MEQDELMRALGGIQAELRSINNQLGSARKHREKHAEKINENTVDINAVKGHGERITKIEKKIYTFSGVLLVITFFASTIKAKLGF